MSVGEALRAAVRSCYENSWRLLLLNLALCGFVLAVVLASLWMPLLVVSALALGPLAAALMHCAVTLVRVGELRFADAIDGLRTHWRRGFVLGMSSGAAGALTVVAVRFYAGRAAWPLAFVALYFALLFLVYQLPLWALAVLERERGLRAVARDAGVVLVKRPAAWTALASALVLINVLGLAAALVPFLTLTVAYSFVATAHLAVPPDLKEV